MVCGGHEYDIFLNLYYYVSMRGRTREDTTIVLKRETWKQLAMLKITLGMRNYDEVIRHLLNNCRNVE